MNIRNLFNCGSSPLRVRKTSFVISPSEGESWGYAGEGRCWCLFQAVPTTEREVNHWEKSWKKSQAVSLQGHSKSCGMSRVFQKSSVPNTALFDVLSCDQLGIIWLLKWQILPDTIFSSCLCCLNLFGLLYQNNHKPDSVYTTEIYFSWFWKLGIPWSSPWQIQCLAKAYFTRFIGGS